MNTKDKLLSSRIRLLLAHPFFGQLMMSLPLRETDQVPTAATNGKEIIYNPEFMDPLTREQCMFILAHEIAHLFLLHHTRRQNRDPKVWNMAGDYAINLILKHSGFQVMQEALIAQKYKDWTTEKIYDYLMQNPQEQPSGGDGDGKGGGQPWNIGGVMDATGKEGQGATKAEVQAIEASMKGKIQNALASAKKAGKLPGCIERMIEQILQPKADWQDILQRFVSAKAFADYNFGMCHTRQLHQYGIINPVLDSPELGDVNVIVDVSGSIRDEELAQFAGELSDVVSNFPGTSINVVYCDTVIQKVDIFEDASDLVLKAVGGGGTQMKPAFDYVAHNFQESSCIILFSDSYLFDWDKIHTPEVPALMACSEKTPDSDTPDWIEVVDIS